MFRNYLTVAVRNLLRHKLYSLINISGLAVGMAGFLLVLRFVQHELSYDRFHPQVDRIHRVIREIRLTDGSQFNLHTSGALAPAIASDHPEVQHATRIRHYSTNLRYQDRAFHQRFNLIDRAFFDIFPLPFLKGDPETALREPNTLVMTEKMAQKFFGNEDPLGKILTVDGRHWDGDFKVTGILRNLPSNSSLQIDFLHTTVGEDLFIQDRWQNWQGIASRSPIFTYVLLSPGVRHTDLERKLPDWIERKMGPEIRASNAYHLQPLTRAHLYSNSDYGIETQADIRHDSRNEGPGIQGDIRQVYLFAFIGVALLAIACINFMNLTTARSANRAREVGMRKVVGAHRTQLVHQFLGESILLTFLALLLALALASGAMPILNAFLNRELNLDLFTDRTLLPGLLSLSLIVGFLSGGYPAFLLSAFQPTQVLKGTPNAGGTWFRKGLVVVQFAVSILLIVSTTMVHRQLTYMRDKKMGFNKNHLVVLPIFITHRESSTDPGGARLASRYMTVKQVFLQHPSVLKATAYTFPFGMGVSNVRLVRAESVKGREIYMPLQQADEDFLDTFEMDLTTGRNFSPDLASDFTDAVVLNETAVKDLGWTDPLGKRFEVAFLQRKATVIGVIKDYHHKPLWDKIGPTGFYMRSGFYSYLALRIKSENIPETVTFLEKTWKQFVPNRPFTFWFLDDQLDPLYRQEVRLGHLFGAFSSLAVVIACLGLFGLAAFMASQRTKEIGIRKTLGASTANIVLLLSREFVQLVLLAAGIATPIAYYATDRWLQGFAYHVDPGILTFVGGGVLALLIALATVSFQTVKAAWTDPVDALRYE